NLLAVAQRDGHSPLNGLKPDGVELVEGTLRSKADRAKAVSIVDLIKRSGESPLTVTYESKPSPERNKYATAAHGAQFIEVKIDPDTMMVKVTRVIEATACGRIMN